MKTKYYQCRYCGKINTIDSFWKWSITPHLGFKKWLKCEHCDAKRHYQRRVFKPELEVRDKLQGAHQTLDFQTAKILHLEEDYGDLMVRYLHAEAETAKKIFADIRSILTPVEGHFYTYTITDSDMYDLKKKYKVEE